LEGGKPVNSRVFPISIGRRLKATNVIFPIFPEYTGAVKGEWLRKRNGAQMAYLLGIGELWRIKAD